MRWLLFLFSLSLCAVSLLTWVEAWNETAWKLAIIAGEFGHYLGIVTLVVVCALVAQLAVIGTQGDRSRVWLAGFTAVLLLVAAVMYFSPAVLALRIAQGLPQKMTTAFGAQTDSRPILNFARMYWSGIDQPTAPVRTHTFAHAGTPEELRLDYYHPGNGPRDPAPCVVLVHGGGWVAGNRHQLPEFNHWLANEGFGVAAISYRLAPRHPWPAQREDALAAIAWLKAHAAELGIDPNRLVLMGRSAGAQIASAVAYARPDPAIRGVIGLYGVYDMEFVWSLAREDDVLNSLWLMNQFLGGEPTAANQADYDSASAQGMVTTGRTPPTLLMHGTIDTLCWVKHSQRLADRLGEEEVPHTFIELPWAVHAFDYNLHGPSGQITQYALKTFLTTVFDPYYTPYPDSQNNENK